MPKEVGRTTARKRIYLIEKGQTPDPDHDLFVDVPVITQINFLDPISRYQETQFSIDNSSGSSRETTISELASAAVPESGIFQDDFGNWFQEQDDNGNYYQVGTVDNPDSIVEFERITTWPVLDTIDRGQETRVSLDNVTGEQEDDTKPPHFFTKLKTHIFRYKNPDNDAAWIDAEVIDRFQVKDLIDRSQETIFTLNNPDVQADIDDEEISDSDNGIDPPWRIDPFQNIVNWGGVWGITVGFTISIGGDGNPVTIGGTHIDSTVDPIAISESYRTVYNQSLDFNTDTATIITSGTGGGPIFTDVSWTYSAATNTATFAPYTLFGVTIYGAISIQTLAANARAPTASPYLGFKFGGTYPFLDTLSVVVDVRGYVADGNTYSYSSNPGPAGTPVIISTDGLTITQIQESEAIINHGDIIGTHTLDLSSISMTYKGNSFHPVALAVTANANSFSVLMKRDAVTA